MGASLSATLIRSPIERILSGFQFGACRERPGERWRAFERLGADARQALD